MIGNHEQAMINLIHTKGKYLELPNRKDRVLIDNELIDIVAYLNSIGLKTDSCCAGHMIKKSYVSVEGFYKLPLSEHCTVKYLPLSRCTAIYYDSCSNSSKKYMKKLIDFTQYITSLKVNDFVPLEFSEVKFREDNTTNLLLYLTNKLDIKPVDFPEKELEVCICLIKKNYPNEINKSRLEEFSSTKEMKYFGE